MAGTRITYGISHLGNFLGAIRRKHRVSQREVAACIGVDLRTVQSLEGQSTDRLSTIRDVGRAISVEFATVALERVNKPLVIMVTNPCASSGSSTLCVALAGCYAGLSKRVLLLYKEQTEDWASYLESRPADKPRIDCCLLDGVPY
jgi:transcriptional regulator with XRE-family HTH domain